MQLLYEIFPVFLFFMAFKFYDIYVATVVGIVATSLQIVINRLTYKRWDHKQLVTLAVFLVFGGMTLYFHNPIFVKWKPTIVFWAFAIIILFVQFFMHKSIMQGLLKNMLPENQCVPEQVWKRLNVAWALFFMSLGTLNLYVAYSLSDDAWVNFKFYGITAALFVFSLFQTFYLMRYMTDTSKQ
ncbi:MAG: hypothetical protein A3F14_04740 [Gammaproteobacteria bacterium RIFCSPHIGHO2_12_FULL_43_28]|nr:MAG: hypothetical protein A3F14_04740 [Gammaproteobacteria bacterium RIFCSPHIGHO2_12_FULL_43_28]